MNKAVQKNGPAFTLIELLTVITIIAILAGLTLSIVGSVTTNAKKSRSAGEVAALQLALARFQIDNGFYPEATNISILTGVTPNVYSTDPNDDAYKKSGRALFLALTGRSKFNSPVADTKWGRQYLELSANQVGDPDIAGVDSNADTTVTNTYATNTFSSGSYIIDPFRNPYGYYHNSAGWNGNGDASLYNTTTPDIWSTSGETKGNFQSDGYYILRWVHNWAQNSVP